MTLGPGTTLGPYEVTAAIGAGGMGEVYSATDTRLDRTVAIKVLPAELAADPERRERFEREAKAIAALNHPHICTLHEFDTHEGIDFLVMEHLEGQSLQGRLEKGALPLDQALEVAIQIADALDKAHRRGITHRDLKPGNILLTRSGAKLLDFGLAKLTQTAPDSEAPTDLAGSLTQQGTILGTFQYMAPEQLEGREVDARVDIWAFGCVLYEMVTGQKAFEGTSRASLIAAILEREPPPLSSHRALENAALERVSAKCLAKDPDRRWQTATDLGDELTWIATAGSGAGVAVSGESSAPSPPRSIPSILITVAATALVVGLAVWGTTLRESVPPRPVIRSVLPLPPTDSVDAEDTLALSPDGTRVVYSATRDGHRQLFVRNLDRLDTSPIPGTQDALQPFFSPDSQWVGFFAEGSLKKVALAGGAPLTLCVAPAPRGAAWGPDDTILFTAGGRVFGRGLMRVAAAGGEPESLTTSVGASAPIHHSAAFVPGARAMLFTVTPSGPTETSANRVVVLSLDTGEQRVLVQGLDALVAPSGHLVFARAGSIWAAPFDVERLELAGDPVPVVQNVQVVPSGRADYGLAKDGSLAYRTPLPTPRQSLVWVSRQGQEEAVGAPPAVYKAVNVSPDGTRIALTIVEEGTDIWIWDVLRSGMSRLTADPGSDEFPVWWPDGQRLLFELHRESDGMVYSRASDGTGAATLVNESSLHQLPQSISADGSQLVVLEVHPSSGRDIALVSLTGEPRTTPLVRTPFNETHAELSPDGRWLAYHSNESGADEVYVRPFPDVDTARWQVSTDGGVKPLWNPAGSELFYWDGQQSALMAVPVATSPRFSAGTPAPLFEGQYYQGPPHHGTYDVAPDGQRFLMIKDDGPPDESANPSQLVLVQNWLEELEARVPTN